MNKFFYGFVTALAILVIVGCAGLTGQNKGVFGKTSQKQADQNERVANIERSESKNSDARLTHIGAWSEGTKYVLDKVQEPTPEVNVAKDVNERIKALANKPDFNEVKEVQAIIDGLLSQMKNQQEEAKKSLASKDEDIAKLNLEVQALNQAKESEVRKALKLAEASAKQADQYRQTLDDMDSFFGFGAIWYGLKKLVTRMAWILGIGAVLFFVLRIAAASNPIAGAIFSVFEQIVAWFINALKMIAPKATQFSGFVESKVFDGYKTTLMRLIDTIQLLKEKETDTKKFTLDDLAMELAKSFDSVDKNRIDDIKKELHWR